MDAFVLIWPENEKKPKLIRVRIHESTENVYVVEFSDYISMKKYQSVLKENVFFDKNEARCETQLENEEILRRNKYITVGKTLISKPKMSQELIKACYKEKCQEEMPD